MKILFVCKSAPPLTVLALSHLIRIVGLGAAILLVPGLCLAASFECSKASSYVEKLVCEDAELSKLDDELASAYKARMLEGKSSNEVSEQRRWLVKRDQCRDRKCVKGAYYQRLTQLRPCRTIPRISADSAHGVVLAANGTVWMWGFNNAGQLAKETEVIHGTRGLSEAPTYPTNDRRCCCS